MANVWAAASRVLDINGLWLAVVAALGCGDPASVQVSLEKRQVVRERLITGLTVSQWDKNDPSQQRDIVADPVSHILGAGFQLSQLTICVLGVMVIASEYSTGMIRASLLAVPKRIPMLLAKCVVFALLVFVVGEVAAFPSFFIGASILHSHAPVALSDPGVLRAVIGAGLYLSVLGLFALAIGALVRHIAAGITGVIGFVLVLAPLAQLLPGSLGKHVHAYCPRRPDS